MRLVGELVHRAPFGKSICQIKVLRSISDHSCVLFVQHILENSQPQALQCRSIVACARLFGNCHVATEGGIPRSSRWVVRFSPPRSSVSTDRQRFSAFPNFDFVSRVCTQLNALQASGRRSSSPSCRQRQLFFSDSGEISSAAEGPVARCRANRWSHLNTIPQKILENQ